jgi:hypothetical protein
MGCGDDDSRPGSGQPRKSGFAVNGLVATLRKREFG